MSIIKAAFAGGGTAGHLSPPLAVLQSFLRQGPTATTDVTAAPPPAEPVAAAAEVLFFAAQKPLDREVLERHNLPHCLLSATGLPYGLSWQTLTGLWRLLRGGHEAFQALREFNPQVLLGCGGYITAATVPAARLVGVPVVLHVSDALPDRASLKLAGQARHITVAYEAAAAHFPPARTIVTGQPVRQEILQADRRSARQALQLSEGEVMLLVTGGSQGARTLNQALTGALPALATAGIKVIHLTGEREYEAVQSELAGTDYGDRYDCRAFERDMGPLLAAADLVVMRAGASSVAEAAALGLPMILVPYPHAGGHQRHNALPLAERGAAILIDDDQFTADRLSALARQLATDASQREAMATAARHWGSREAADRLAALLWQTATGGNRSPEVQ
jgi:UDP-N-acetylglucosamine--N-acetylmuramyl-(pentapeptide) pyrophosphoryl-undecaprenol N-acetylglucosamine transferase